jgi:glycosyltransferase involved in cell wall biosynthesis
VFSSVTGPSSKRVDGVNASSDEAKVLIVEEYIPEYRRRFLEMLEETLDPKSIRLGVAVGTPGPAVALEDGVPALAIVRAVPARSVSIAGRRLTFRRLSELAADSDLIIVDQGLRHLENYLLLLRQRRGPRVALWGHGKRLVKPATRLERLVERRMTRSGHWFFAYTERGADHVAASGFPRDRITIVQNTLDVGDLARLRNEVTEDERQLLRNELNLPQQNVCLYVGALTPHKRLDFLLEACSIVARRIPEFTLVVAGDGPQRHLVEGSLAFYPWLRYVGRALGREKAKLGAVSDVLLMPGAVGLIAVDSFALQTPIITTVWPYHGPEVDYLEDGINARISNNTVADFARTVEHVLLAREELARMKAACAAARPNYSIEHMVANFTDGVVSALAAPRR